MTLQSSYIFLKKECASKKDQVDSAGNKILVIEVGHRIHNYIMKLFPGASRKNHQRAVQKQNYLCDAS